MKIFLKQVIVIISLIIKTLFLNKIYNLMYFIRSQMTGSTWSTVGKLVRTSKKILLVLSKFIKFFYVVGWILITLKRITFSALYIWYISFCLASLILHKQVIIKYHLAIFGYQLLNYNMSVFYFFFSLTIILIFIINPLITKNTIYDAILIYLLVFLGRRISLSSLYHLDDVFLINDLFTIIVI